MGALAQVFKDIGQTRAIALIGTGLLLLVMFFFISSRISATPMAPIYSDLSIEDSGKVVSELDKMGVQYELRANGTQILIPSDQVLRLRLSLAQQGLPSGGSIIGYEIFDRSDTMGTSSYVMNVNMMRALEGELARTIKSMSQVEAARVHLVIPKQELFTREKQEPTASVMLKLHGVTELNKEQIRSITHLIATAVPGLKPSNVTLVDNKGDLLSGGAGDAGDAAQVASTAESYRLAFESQLRAKLESLLEKSIGQGKVKVSVNADIDFDRVVTNSEIYDPEGQVVRSVQTGEEREQSAEREGRENTSVANNLPNNQATANNAGSTRTIEKTDETTNYEISKTIKNHVQESGKVNKISVAVLVDGTYSEDPSGKEVYVPRSEDERKQVDTLVKSAIGFDEKRGDKVDVVNMRFIAPADATGAMSMLDWLKQDFRSIFQTLVFGAVAVLVVLLVIRPLVKRVIEATLTTATADEMVEQRSPMLALQGAAGLGGGRLEGGGAPGRLPQGGGGMEGQAAAAFAAPEAEDEPLVDISRISGRVKSSIYNRLNDLVEKHPDEAINVVRQWASRRT